METIFRNSEVIKNHETVTGNSPIRIYVNKIGI